MALVREGYTGEVMEQLPLLEENTEIKNLSQMATVSQSLTNLLESSKEFLVILN